MCGSIERVDQTVLQCHNKLENPRGGLKYSDITKCSHIAWLLTFKHSLPQVGSRQVARSILHVLSVIEIPVSMYMIFKGAPRKNLFQIYVLSWPGIKMAHWMKGLRVCYIRSIKLMDTLEIKPDPHPSIRKLFKQLILAMVWQWTNYKKKSSFPSRYGQWLSSILHVLYCVCSQFFLV